MEKLGIGKCNLWQGLKCSIKYIGKKNVVGGVTVRFSRVKIQNKENNHCRTQLELRKEERKTDKNQALGSNVVE